MLEGEETDISAPTSVVITFWPAPGGDDPVMASTRVAIITSIFSMTRPTGRAGARARGARAGLNGTSRQDRRELFLTPTECGWIVKNEKVA